MNGSRTVERAIGSLGLVNGAVGQGFYACQR